MTLHKLSGNVALIKQNYSNMVEEKPKILALFDVDQTLAFAGKTIEADMIETLATMRAKGIHFGIVGGSDRSKIRR
jgi:hypothetical protein